MSKLYDRLYSFYGRRPTQEEYDDYKKLYRRKTLTTRAFCRRHGIDPNDFIEEMKGLTPDQLKVYTCKFSLRKE